MTILVWRGCQAYPRRITFLSDSASNLLEDSAERSCFQGYNRSQGPLGAEKRGLAMKFRLLLLSAALSTFLLIPASFGQTGTPGSQPVPAALPARLCRAVIPESRALRLGRAAPPLPTPPRRALKALQSSLPIPTRLNTTVARMTWMPSAIGRLGNVDWAIGTPSKATSRWGNNIR